MMLVDAHFLEKIHHQVSLALDEDIGTGDITAQLIPVDQQLKAHIISREEAVLCGTPWFNMVFTILDPSVIIKWHYEEGDPLQKDTPFVTLQGNARSILTGERTALNFLQTLSYTATIARQYQSLVKGLTLTILDTRKTIPGMRLAQKYAVEIGGAKNHRIGLFDAFLIKENHIMAAGSIAKAVAMAHAIAPGKKVEVETETLDEVKQAVLAGADIIMLDNFTLDDMKCAVDLYRDQVKFEASGNMTQDDIKKVAQTGVDYISIGALTKHIHAIDLSLRVIHS